MKRIGPIASTIALTVGLCALPVRLSASPLSGTFNLSGVITATANTITWESGTAVANQADIAMAGLTGSFVGLGGTTVTISDLSNPPDVVDGSGFADTTFISFNANPSLASLLINYIFPGVYSSADCASLPPLAGQVCTISPTNSSPFSLTNLGSPGSTPTGSSAAFAFSGVSSDHLSTWTGNFTSQFNVPYQTVLSELASAGSVSNTYSATITVSAVPEPNTVLLIFSGVCLFVFGLRRRSMA